jgi:putative hydrolase of the HAD superfamily
VDTITTLFLDIGGVLLTNGWDSGMRKEAAREFGIDYPDMSARHRKAFPAFEKGRITLDEYLERVVFTRERSFSAAEFREFMFSRSRPYPEMIELFRDLKARHRLKVAAVSNEGRELTEYRVRRFDLGSWIDFFVSSCFVGLRKPDARIYRLALDLAQVPAEQAAYIEDRPGSVEAARAQGIRGIHHVEYAATRASLESLGLSAAG